jgi:hypothetical protein
MPLPKEWKKPFRIKGNWNQENLSRVIVYLANREDTTLAGEGTSRTAYVVNYEGRETVIKVARSPIGLIQNKNEARIMFHEPALAATKMVVPGIDCDTKTPPAWIHMEYAAPISKYNFQQYTGGGTPTDLLAYSKSILPDLFPDTAEDGDKSRIDPSLNFVKRFIQFVKLCDEDVDDFHTLYNWGLYQGKPVLIDVGYNSDVEDAYNGITLDDQDD